MGLLNLPSPSGAGNLYGPEDYARARARSQESPWARETLERLLEGDTPRYYFGSLAGPSRRLKDLPLETLWKLLPSTKLARFVPAEFKGVDPKVGMEARRIDGFCPYRISPLEHPYQVQSMATGDWYPSNRWDLGDLKTGPWVDTGEGIPLESGMRFFALREYAHMVYGSFFLPSLSSLARVYRILSDESYGTPARLLMVRLAQQYPSPKDEEGRGFYALYDGQSPDNSWSKGGRISGPIWESAMVKSAILSFDFLRGSFDDPTLLAFLATKGLEFQSGAEVEKYIEDRFLRSVGEGVLSGDLLGNPGFHQSTAMACALVLGDHALPGGLSQRLVRWFVKGEGGGLSYLENSLHRDGTAYESPTYNRIRAEFVYAFEYLEKIRNLHPDLYPRDEFPTGFDHPKVIALMDSFRKMLIQNALAPPFGDAGTHRDGSSWPSRFGSQVGNENWLMYRRGGEPRFLEAFRFGTFDRSLPSLFEDYPEGLEVGQGEPPTLPTRLLDDYGLAVLRPDPDTDSSLVLNYANLRVHRHFDPLNLEWHVRGVSLLPDLGFPKDLDYRWKFDGHSLLHNVVTIDESSSEWISGGRGRVLASAQGLTLFSATHLPFGIRGEIAGGSRAAEVQMGPKNSIYERTILQVKNPGQDGYWLDLFVVDGGSQHDQSWHSWAGGLELEPGLSLEPGRGTLAGPEVAPFTSWTDRWERTREDAYSFVSLQGSKELTGPLRIGFSPPNQGTELRPQLHILPLKDRLELLVGQASAPNRPEDWKLPLAVIRSRVEGTERSRFLTLGRLKNPQNEISAIRILEREPIRIQVETPAWTDTLELEVGAVPSVSSYPNSLRVRWTRGESSVSFRSPGHLFAIRDVDPERNRVRIEAPQGLFENRRWVRVFQNRRSQLETIRSVQEAENGSWLELEHGFSLGKAQVLACVEGGLLVTPVLDRASTIQDAELELRTGYFMGPGALRKTEGLDPYQGATILVGARSLRVRAVEVAKEREGVGRSQKIWIEDCPPWKRLEKDLLGREIRLQALTAGDLLELPEIQSRTPPSGND